MVAAYAQDLGILLLELLVKLPERGGLDSSTTGEVQDVKGEDYVFFASVLAQADLFLIPIDEGPNLKIGSYVANFSHLFTFFQLILP